MSLVSSNLCRNQAAWRARISRSYFFVVLTFLLTTAPQPLMAQTASFREYEVKAAFLLNFAQFVSWPASRAANKPMIFGVLGTDPFGKVLDETMSGRTINSVPVQIRRLRRGESTDDIDILFISRSEDEVLEVRLAKQEQRPTLTVGDIDRFAQRGGMIGFIIRDGRVRFQINHRVAEDAGLTVNAKLLKLAEIVNTDEDELGN